MKATRPSASHDNKYFWDFTDFTFDESGMNRVDFRKVAVGKDGRVYVAVERDDYVINVYTADGTLERVIEREFTHRERDDDEIQPGQGDHGGRTGPDPQRQDRAVQNQPDIGSLEFRHRRQPVGRDQPQRHRSARGHLDRPGTSSSRTAISSRP